MSTTEQESRQVAEEARETEWAGRTFLRELFLGKFSLPLIHPFPMEAAERPEFTRFYQAMETFLREQVDSAAIDETGEYPEHVVDGLRKLGAFGMKIPTEYGGLGFTVSEYCKVMEMIGSYDGNITALLSAHQSIGVPQPLKLFGTPEQKKKYLPRCAAGAISAFALTEPHVGSDPASLSTTARRDGDFFVLNGEKLWCTNGTLAELLVVMARDPKTKKISAFVVETDWPGREGRVPLPLHGPEGAGQRRDQLQRRARAAREPDRRGGQGPQDRAHHPQHRPPHAARAPAPASPSSAWRSSAAGRTRGSSGACRSGSTRRSAHIIADMAATTFAMDSISKLASADGRSRRLRHPPRGRGRQGVEHGPRLGDRRQDAADPRRARLRDRDVAARAAASSRSRSSA